LSIRNTFTKSPGIPYSSHAQLPIKRVMNGCFSSLSTFLTGLSILVSWFRLISLPRIQVRGTWIVKRCIDICVSALALIVKMTDFGPVFFWQERVGMHGVVFRFPKFRSMVTQAEALKLQLLAQNQHGDSITFKMKTDPRITPVGRWIRRFSVDELPQLWCVLRGQMSLVGPRPAVPREVERYTLRDRVRLNTLPGLTCIWQVSGRSEIPFEQQVKLDEQYFLQQSLGMDLRLLMKTIPAVLNGKGAY
jgi:lipopolysaccharide/colanic/teichoic acid biosynthesis glycosyltransferase